MFTTVVLYIVFIITSIMTPLLWISVFSLMGDGLPINWKKVWTVSVIWFASGSYLFG